jgi:hypothetical protein
MPCSRPAILILNPTRPERSKMSHRRARGAVLDGTATWVQFGVSVRLVVARANVAAPVAAWEQCWRTADAAVLQPYQPYQALRSGSVVG